MNVEKEMPETNPAKVNPPKKKAGNMKSEFAPVLGKVCAAAWVLKLIPIPVGLWNAALLSRTVTCAVAGDTGNVLKYGAAVLLLLALTKIFDFAAGSAYKRAASRALHRCRLLLYRRFLSCPLSLLYKTEHGQAVELLNDDFDTVTGKTLNLYPGFFTGLATLAAYFAFLLARNLPAALALWGISLLQVIPPLLTKRFFQENYQDTREIEAEITNCTLEYYHGFDTIKMFALKQWCLDRLAALHKDYLKIGNRSEATATAENVLDQLIGNILTFGTYGLVGFFILQGYTGLEAGVEALALSGGLYAAAKNVFDAIPSFGMAKTAQQRMALLSPKNSVPEKTVPKPSCRTEGGADKAGICLENVSCGFGERQLLSHLYLRFPACGISLVRGANGMGKSTLLKLIPGMVLPDTGSCRINGIPSQTLPQGSFPRRLFYLPQEDPAFHLSAEELYASVPDVNPEAARSCALEFSLTPESLRQPVDTLSGGQCKKVFLALAFGINPELMLLDEPGNSLDVESKETLIRLLKQRKGGTVLITHDPAFDCIADVFYTLQAPSAIVKEYPGSKTERNHHENEKTNL